MGLSSLKEKLSPKIQTWMGRLPKYNRAYGNGTRGPWESDFQTRRKPCRWKGYRVSECVWARGSVCTCVGAYVCVHVCTCMCLCELLAHMRISA